MVEMRRSSSSSKCPLSLPVISFLTPNKRFKAFELFNEAIGSHKEFGSESRVTDLRPSDLRAFDATKATNASILDKSADADVDNEILVFPWSLGEAAIGAEKTKAIVIVFTGQVKKRTSKITF